MKSVYISSTYEDLKDYRQAVADVLRDCGYNVDAMEKYPARDDRPKAASEADVSNCDIYIGIFAWRYGHVPGEDNPENKSRAKDRSLFRHPVRCLPRPMSSGGDGLPTSEFRGRIAEKAESTSSSAPTTPVHCQRKAISFVIAARTSSPS
jgi:Domain of unknown function (DUF4062)